MQNLQKNLQMLIKHHGATSSAAIIKWSRRQWFNISITVICRCTLFTEIFSAYFFQSQTKMKAVVRRCMQAFKTYRQKTDARKLEMNRIVSCGISWNSDVKQIVASINVKQSILTKNKNNDRIQYNNVCSICIRMFSFLLYECALVTFLIKGYLT